MKVGKKIKSSYRKEIFNKGKFKFDADFKEFKKVIKLCNTYRCQMILTQEEGMSLPSNLGRLIILGVKPRVKNLYSMTTPGTKITNLHSFGWIYRVMHKEKLLMRYPTLYKFRPHRQNLKVPIFNAVVNKGKSFIKQPNYL